jgi:hypothetical protein
VVKLASVSTAAALFLIESASTAPRLRV